ncbi:MAG: hypothetical protein GXY57_03260 [Erysipelotrichaceae bacterium]|nr:hypothetical protein [Erysipelotrichaceae bacterium]
MIQPISFVFFALFVVASFIQLVAAFLEKEFLRKISKPFCVLFLAIAVAVTIPNHPLVCIGAFLGVLGDIALISKSRRIFCLGTALFLAGHICYLCEMIFVIMGVNPLPWWFYVVVAFGILLFTLAGYPFSKKITQNRYLALLGNTYLAILLLVSIVSIIASSRGYLDFMILGVIGGISFLASDLILTKSFFIKDFKRRDYYIMLFYLLGQGLILIGITLTYVLV